MIRYEKKRAIGVRRTIVPQPPFWARTTLSPYTWPRAVPLSIDYQALTARGTEAMDVEVSDRLDDQLAREATIEGPVLIDATGPAEMIYRRGREAVEWTTAHRLASTLLISADCADADESTSSGAQLAVAAWPLSIERLGELFQKLSGSGFRWGVAVPVIYPVATDLALLESLADLAARAGAEFLGALPIDLEPTAKRALAGLLALGDEDDAYTNLFHSELETITVATERHIAALARERSLLDFVPPPSADQRTNWNAAVHLTLASTRMLRLKDRTEFAWTLLRAAQSVATLQKPIERIASVASLSIIPGLGAEISVALEEWTRTGRSALTDAVHGQWPLRRDHGTR